MWEGYGVSRDVCSEKGREIVWMDEADQSVELKVFFVAYRTRYRSLTDVNSLRLHYGCVTVAGILGWLLEFGSDVGRLRL